MIRKTIALVVGHSAHSMGAQNYIGEYEYQFNSRIATKVKLKLDRLKQMRVQLVVVYKVNGKLFFLEKRKFFLAIEMHFNSFGQNVHGTETFISSHARFQDLFSGPIYEFHSRMIKLLDTKDRGLRMLKSDERGHANLLEYDGIAKHACIFEPCFQSNIPGNRKIFEDEDRYVNAIVDTLLGIGNL